MGSGLVSNMAEVRENEGSVGWGFGDGGRRIGPVAAKWVQGRRVRNSGLTSLELLNRGCPALALQTAHFDPLSFRLRIHHDCGVVVFAFGVFGAGKGDNNECVESLRLGLIIRRNYWQSVFV